MHDRKIILALDIGTTAIKSVAFEFETMALIGYVKEDVNKSICEGIVEQDPDEIIIKSINSLKSLVKTYNINISSCVGLGITNQRETTIIWDKNTGTPIYNAIVWEDKRTQKWCDSQSEDTKTLIENTAHLELLPYFSASKIKWILENCDIENKNLMFGTVDTWALWNLSEGNAHATDSTNASRTMLFDTNNKIWSDALIKLFGVESVAFPQVKQSSSLFGYLKEEILGKRIPILAMCGDQQSSMFSAQQYCKSEIGCTKITFGTGLFLMQIVGDLDKIIEPFYPSLAVSSDALGTIWALEYKIENIGSEVEMLLGDENALTIYLEKLTDKVASVIKQLPIKPKEIIIDGGVTQNKLLRVLLQEKTGIKISELPNYNGTALGVAMLVKSNLVLGSGRYL